MQYFYTVFLCFQGVLYLRMMETAPTPQWPFRDACVSSSSITNRSTLSSCREADLELITSSSLTSVASVTGMTIRNSGCEVCEGSRVVKNMKYCQAGNALMLKKCTKLPEYIVILKVDVVGPLSQWPHPPLHLLRVCPRAVVYRAKLEGRHRQRSLIRESRHLSIKQLSLKLH